MPAVKSVHFLVCIHGMWGSPDHLSTLAETIKDTYRTSDATDTELDVLVAKTNRDDGTYDGIDWCAERVADEVDARIQELEQDGTKKVTKFSVAGYSLGGLVSRYLIGILYSRKFFDTVTPVNFSTFATPHIGLPRYSGFVSTVMSALGPKLLSRTGEQFYGVDKWSSSNRSLLEVMADKDQVFFKGLALFPHLTLYGNAVNDITVAYVTSCIEPYDPFMAHETNGIQLEFDSKYDPILKSWKEAENPPPPPKKPSFFSLEYIRSLRSDRPLLPPALQFRFPLNIVFFAAVPILVPIILTLVLVRFSMATHASRERIKLLESDKSSDTKLLNVLRHLEKEVEDAVADMVEENDDDDAQNQNKPKTLPSEQPLLTPIHLAMIASLNTLPNLKKHPVFIHPVRNAHAPIICRDVKRFKAHERGRGVLQHWADQFEL